MSVLKKQRVEPETPAGVPLSNLSDGIKPWVEKYRPRTLAQVEAQGEAVAALRACLEAGANMPHMLFYGPPGTGKTSAILAAAHELFGPDFLSSRVKELNASDDRGIAVVRDKVKKFAQGAASSLKAKVQSDGKVYPVPAFKLLILDEADALLPDAQAALRRMMEDFSEVTRFCILCNYVTKIIDPISSRCAKFRFKPLDADSVRRRVFTIAAAEGIQVDDDAIQHLDSASNGDLRLALVYLQSAVRAFGRDLRGHDFVQISGMVPQQELARYQAALLSRRFESIHDATLELVQQGYGAHQLLVQLQRWIVSSDCPLGAAAKGIVCLRLAQTEKRLIDRGDDLLQLLGFAECFAGLPN